MSDTTTTFELYRDAGLGFQKIRTFGSEIEAKTYAQGQQSRVEEAYEIRAVITTVSTLDSFTVPAHVPTLEEIAQDIIGYADGAFSIEWSEDYEKLSEDDQRLVEDMVHEEISNCDHCGWHFSTHSMESGVLSGDWLCYKCAQDEEEEADEDEEEQ